MIGSVLFVRKSFESFQVRNGNVFCIRFLKCVGFEAAHLTDDKIKRLKYNDLPRGAIAVKTSKYLLGHPLSIVSELQSFILVGFSFFGKLYTECDACKKCWDDDKNSVKKCSRIIDDELRDSHNSIEVSSLKFSLY